MKDEVTYQFQSQLFYILRSMFYSFLILKMSLILAKKNPQGAPSLAPGHVAEIDTEP